MNDRKCACCGWDDARSDAENRAELRARMARAIQLYAAAHPEEFRRWADDLQDPDYWRRRYPIPSRLS